MGQAGHVNMLARTEPGEAGYQVGIHCLEGGSSGHERFSAEPPDRVGYQDLLPHVTHGLIGHQEDRNAVLVREVKGLHREFVHLLNSSRAECDDGVIPVRTEPHLHHISLCRHRGLAG